jgi:hypothetical protein
MSELQNDCRQDFLRAIKKAADENPDLAPSTSGAAHATEDIYDMLATLTADGEGGLIVFLTGREFAGKVLKEIPNPDRYEVCALMHKAIKHGYSVKDVKGNLLGENFYTSAYKEVLNQTGPQVMAEPV